MLGYIMKGILNTANMLRAVVNREHGLTNGSLVSHFTLAEISGYHKLIAYTDVGIVISPTFEQKTDILNNALNTMRTWGYENPKAAILTAVETINPKMPETQDAAELKKMALEGKFGNCIVEGPISFDLTFNSEIAQIKGFKSPVVGNADILLVPSVVTGNIMAKTIMTFAKMKSLALALGALAPMVITSRGTTIEGKYRSIIAAAGAVKN